MKSAEVERKDWGLLIMTPGPGRFVPRARLPLSLFPLFLRFPTFRPLFFEPSGKEPLNCGGERGIWDNREIMLSPALNVGDQSLPFLKAQVRKCIKFVDYLCASTLRRRLVDS